MKFSIYASIFSAILLLSACKPYQMNIPQGKPITASQRAEIKSGMTKAAVLQILGQPLQGESIYNPNRLDYISTMQINGGDIEEKVFSIYFKNNLVEKVEYKEELAEKSN